MDHIPGIGLRVKPEEESIGTDLALMGEIAYELPGLKRGSTKAKIATMGDSSPPQAQDALEIQPMKEPVKEEEERGNEARELSVDKSVE